MVKAVIFDLDGLLIDTEIIAYKIYKEISREYGYDFSKEEYVKNYSGIAMRKNVANFIETYHLPWTLEEGVEKVRAMEIRMLEEGVDLKAGAETLLSYLKTHGYKIGVASSSIEKRAMDILEQHDVAKYFDKFVFGHEVTKGKPHPDIFIKACEKLGEEPEDCLVLEDSEAGIQAAHSAQIPVICIPDMKIPGEDFLKMTEIMLDSLADVVPYLENKSLK